MVHVQTATKGCGSDPLLRTREDVETDSLRHTVDAGKVMKPLGLRYAVTLATNHAVGILESQNDDEFWGEDFMAEHADDWQILAKAKAIVLKRIEPRNHEYKHDFSRMRP